MKSYPLVQCNYLQCISFLIWFCRSSSSWPSTIENWRITCISKIWKSRNHGVSQSYPLFQPSLIQSFSSFGFYPTEWFQETLIWLLLQVLLCWMKKRSTWKDNEEAETLSNAVLETEVFVWLPFRWSTAHLVLKVVTDGDLIQHPATTQNGRRARINRKTNGLNAKDTTICDLESSSTRSTLWDGKRDDSWVFNNKSVSRRFLCQSSKSSRF